MPSPVPAAFPARLPLVQAPMAGVTTPELVAAVSNAGALGSLGAGYLSAEQLSGQLRQIRERTDQPFGVNLFVPSPEPEFSTAQLDAALRALQPMCRDLSLPAPNLRQPHAPDFAEQLDVVMEDGPAAVSFTFGLPTLSAVQELQRRVRRVWLTATSLEEAQEALVLRPDGLIAQGGPAGGHRGSWRQDALQDTLEFTQQVAALGSPVIAAGGLMTPADVRSALAAGAVAAQCGTAFLLAAEAGTSAPYQAALRQAQSGGQAAETVLKRGPSGRWARGLPNRLTAVEDVLPYPAQNALTQPLRAEAARQQRPEWLSLWEGEGVAAIQDERTAAELVGWLCGEISA